MTDTKLNSLVLLDSPIVSAPTYVYGELAGASVKAVPGGGAAGGSSGQLQYNNAGSLGGMLGTLWTAASKTLTLSGPLALPASNAYPAGVAAISILPGSPTDNGPLGINGFASANGGSSVISDHLVVGVNIPDSGNLRLNTSRPASYRGFATNYIPGGTSPAYCTEESVFIASDGTIGLGERIQWDATNKLLYSHHVAMPDWFNSGAGVCFGVYNPMAEDINTGISVSLFALNNALPGVLLTNNSQSWSFLHYGSASSPANNLQVRDFTNAVANMVFQAATGFVGINGITNPTQSLHVGGNALITTDVIVGAGTATNATSGFLYIDSGAGTPTGVPSGHSGTVPLYFDTTNSQLWIYTGGAWKQPKTPAAAAIVTWQ